MTLQRTGSAAGLAHTSFPFPHRLFRVLWATSWFLLAAWTPPPLHGWRRIVLRAFGAKLEKGARVYGSARIWYPPNLTMGIDAVLGPRVNCYCQGRITLGDYAVVSQSAQLVTGTHDIDNADFALVTRPILIGRHAWIAASAFVGPGVSIGDGAVLGACAVTFKDLPDRSVYVGNPAKFIRMRGIITSPSPRAAP